MFPHFKNSTSIGPVVIYRYSVLLKSKKPYASQLVLVTTWFWVQFGVTRHEKIFQDNKIAQDVRVSAICRFWKISISYLHQTAHKIMSILINNSPEKKLQNWDWWNFDIAHATCNLHLCHNFALMLQLELVLHEKYTHFQPIRRVRVFHVYY